MTACRACAHACAPPTTDVAPSLARRAHIVGQGLDAYRDAAGCDKDGVLDAIGVVGLRNSMLSLPVAQLATIDRILQISYAASSTEFSMPGLFPYFGRSFPSDAISAAFLSRLIADFGWQYVATINRIDDPFGASYATEMKKHDQFHNGDNRLVEASPRAPIPRHAILS